MRAKLAYLAAVVVLALTAAPALAQTLPVLGFDRPLKGELTRSDEVDSEGGHVDRLAFAGRKGQIIRVLVESKAFAPGAVLTDANNRALAASEGGIANPRQILQLRLPADGTYVVHVFGQGESDFGAYTVEMGDATVSTEAGTYPELLSTGDEVYGTISVGDERREMVFFDAYEMAAFKGEVLTVKLSARGFRPYVMISADDKKLFDATASPDASFQLKVQEDTVYRVVITDLGGARGAYTLSVTPSR